VNHRGTDMVYITRIERFNAAHKLWRNEWSEEKNREVFGKCSNVNWHGHNYTLHVTVKGKPDPTTGFVADLKDLSEIIRKNVINDLDHKNINLDVEWMKDIMASTENLATEIWKRVEEPISHLGCKLHCIKIYETENNYVEYFGE
jgi:6-pyruvoyltetrahydropterin/6-carboxytetrahydropterin synthase